MTFDQTPFKSFDAERNARLAAGLASPLWAPFFVAASAGVAFWWMTAGVRRQLEAVPSFAAAETKSFAPLPAEPAAAPANDIEIAAPEAVMEHAEAASASVAAEPVEMPVSEAPVAQAEAVMDHSLPEADADDGLTAAEEALADTQAEVAKLAAEAATAELSPKPRSRKKG